MGSQERPKSRRGFRIFESDPRFRQATRGIGSKRAREGRDAHELRTKVHAALRQARDKSLAEGSKITNKSHMAYWAEFCELYDIDSEEFGALATGEALPPLELIRSEEDTLAAFMAFVIACPRKGTSSNTASYALQCISTVRSHYALANGRRPGLREGNRTGGQLRAVVRGFQKTNPARRESRVPILQQHLRAIKLQLDLKNNAYHKALWALWLTQWQGVLRSADLIKKMRDANRPWDPAQETHRGRLTVDMATDMNGKMLGPRLKLLLKPNKTDQAGQKNTVKAFVVDEHPEALSAGQAIREMLRADSQDADRQVTPLFRNPTTGKEITYEESSAALHMCLKRAGYANCAVGTHSLRIGGATAYANATSGGYAVSGFMGLWASSSKDWYMHACAPRLDLASLEIGRAKAWEVAQRPGPVARYAS